MFMAFYTAKFVNICVFMTFYISCFLGETLMGPWTVYMYVCVYACVYVDIYTPYEGFFVSQVSKTWGKCAL
jgi:hypothetical protein